MLFTPPPPARCPESRWRRRRWWAWVGRWASVNIHARVYVHMYTYVQTRRGPGQAAPWNPGPATLSLPFPSAEGRRAGERTKAKAWSDTAASRFRPQGPKPSSRAQRRGQLRLCACVCVVREGTRVHLCPLGPQPPRGLRAQSRQPRGDPHVISEGKRKM